MDLTFLLLLLGMNTTTLDDQPNITPPRIFTKLSPDIVNELKDFKNLVSETTIDELIAKHLIIDGDFRIALLFIRSGEFNVLLQNVQQIPEIIEILNFLHVNVINTTTTTTITTTTTPSYRDRIFYKYKKQQQHYYQHFYSEITSHSQHLFEQQQKKNEQQQQQQMQPQLTTHELTQLRAVTHHSSDVDVNGDYDDVAITIDKMLNVLPQFKIVLLSDVDGIDSINSNKIDDNLSSSSSLSSSPAYNLGKFADFIEEVTSHIPRNNLIQMITEKRQKSDAFAKFYVALKSASLKPLVDAALKSKNLVTTIKKLSDKRIYVSSLEPIGWEVLSWCPEV